MRGGRARLLPNVFCFRLLDSCLLRVTRVEAVQKGELRLSQGIELGEFSLPKICVKLVHQGGRCVVVNLPEGGGEAAQLPQPGRRVAGP